MRGTRTRAGITCPFAAGGASLIVYRPAARCTANAPAVTRARTVGLASREKRTKAPACGGSQASPLGQAAIRVPVSVPRTLSTGAVGAGAAGVGAGAGVEVGVVIGGSHGSPIGQGIAAGRGAASVRPRINAAIAARITGTGYPRNSSPKRRGPANAGPRLRAFEAYARLWSGEEVLRPCDQVGLLRRRSVRLQREGEEDDLVGNGAGPRAREGQRVRL